MLNPSLFGSFCLSFSIGILPQSEKFFLRADELSQKLAIPVLSYPSPKGFNFYLRVGEHISLELNKAGAPGPLWVDYSKGDIKFRRLSGRQLLLKAVGGPGKTVFDATAGLGRDAFVLASLGCKVRAVEKSPVIGELVIDALSRGAANQDIKTFCERIEFSVGHSENYIEKLEAWQFDTLYIDPMFPEKKKSALPKKEMKILQEFFEQQNLEKDNAVELLREGSKKFKRIVVKRPLRGPELFAGVKVKFKGSSTRFDVYVFEN